MFTKLGILCCDSEDLTGDFRKSFNELKLLLCSRLDPCSLTKFKSDRLRSLVNESSFRYL